jgi:hypothetical protein
MKHVREAPIKKDVDEDEQAIGDGNREELWNPVALSDEFHAGCGGGITNCDESNAAETRGAAVDQQHIETKAGEDHCRDLDCAKVYQKVILPLLVSFGSDELWVTDRTAKLIGLGVGLPEGYTKIRGLSSATFKDNAMGGGRG